MTNTIIHILSVFFLLLTNDNKNDIQAQDNPFLETAVVKEIEQYYHQKYKEGNRVVREVSEDIITIIDYFKNAYSENNYESFVLRIEIPKEKESEHILIGDLNNDNTEDLIVGVITQGGGYGGKIYWIDYFVFLKKDNNYHLTIVNSNRELSECDAGYVYFNKIEDNTIKGTESCFTEGDGRCCPSLHYEVEIEVVDEVFVVKNKCNKENCKGITFLAD